MIARFLSDFNILLLWTCNWFGLICGDLYIVGVFKEVDRLGCAVFCINVIAIDTVLGYQFVNFFFGRCKGFRVDSNAFSSWVRDLIIILSLYVSGIWFAGFIIGWGKIFSSVMTNICINELVIARDKASFLRFSDVLLNGPT